MTGIKPAALKRVENGFLISGYLDFTTVPVLAAEVIKILRERQKNAEMASGVDVDLVEVMDSNSAGVALLLEINRLCLTYNTQLRIKNVPEQMDVIAKAHGVDDFLHTLSHEKVV